MLESSRHHAGIFENSWRGAAAEADAIGEQQTKRTPSGSRVGIRGAAAEADAIRNQLTAIERSNWSGRKRRKAAEADASRELSSS